MNKSVTTILAVLATIAIFFAGNIVVQRTARGAKIDLTQDKLFTLSAGAKQIASKIKEPIQLTLYYSEKQGNDIPGFKSHAVRVKELLQEYAGAAKGNLQIKVVNPEPFSDAEDKAVAAGLVGMPTQRGNDRFYFGIVGDNSTGKTETLPFLSPDKEEFLEYDVTRMIYVLSDPPKKKVAVLSWLPIEGERGGENPMMPQRGSPPYQIYKQLQELFTPQMLPTTMTEVPADIKVLLLIHPKGISLTAQYAIDQFVLRGGRLVVLVDPLCESDIPPGMNPIQSMQFPKASELTKLMAAWGVEMPKDKIAADRTSAAMVNVGTPTRPEGAEYIVWMRLAPTQRDANDPITGQLQQGLILASAGYLQPTQGATTKLQPLVFTTKNSMVLGAETVSFVPEPKKLLAQFKSGDKPLTLAARITGDVKSAFDGPPADGPDADPAKIAAAKEKHLVQSTEPIDVVVIADCDMLTDRFWAQEQRLGDISLGVRKMSDNGDMIIAAIDNYSGSSDVQSLRARGSAQRPFERVQEIEQDARQRYAAKETELQARLQETERKITELQQQRSDGAGGAGGTVMLTPEQQKEIETFRTQMVATRKELREVQHQLRKDIEGMGTRLKALNIGLMPVLVGIGALGLAAYRSSRRSADRRSAANE